MSKVIPEGWQNIQLVKAAKPILYGTKPFQGTRIYVATADLNGQGICSGIPVTYEDKPSRADLELKEGDLIFARMKETIKVFEAFGVIDNFIFSTGFAGFRPNKFLNSRFLKQIFLSKSFNSQKDILCTGTTQKAITAHGIGQICILLPPLSEQRKIAAILLSVDNAIEKTKAVIEQTKVLKKGLMQELLTCGIPGRHKKFKKTPIGEIPEEWEVVKLEKLGVFSSGFTINQDRVPKNNPRPYLRVANVQKGYFLLNEIKFLEATNEEFLSRQIQRNDILILEGHANLNELGRCAVAKDEVIGMTHQNHIHRFSPKLSLCDPNYIALALSIEQVRRLIELEGGTTSGLHTLSRNSIASVPIALPSLSEQSLITKCILSIHNSFDRNEIFLNHLYDIKSALMQVLLTGEVRVKT